MSEATKKVTVKLAALTRVEYMEVIEVPVSMTDEQLDALINQRYDQVDGGLFWNDPDYWQRATCECVLADNEDTPSLRLSIAQDGKFNLQSISEGA